MAKRKCRICSKEFGFTQDDLEFLEKVSPIIGGISYKIPAPTLCDDCREQNRLIWRNDRHVYKRKSNKTGNEIISIYPPDRTEFKVWENNLWRQDDWDPMNFAISYDSTKSFFEQYGELLKSVPRQATNSTMNENSDYSNQTWKSKNLYLCFNVGPAEDCYYCSETWFSKNCCDCLYVKNSEYCYSCFDIHDSSNCYYSEKITNCSDVFFSFDCIGCHNILLCGNLRNRDYCILNKQYSKDEYLEKIKEYDLGNRSDIEKLRSEFAKIKAKAIHKENSNQKTENCTGDYLVECKDCTDCYYSHTSVNCHRVINVDNDAKDCRDCDFITEAEACYNSTSVAGHKNHFRSG